MSTKRPDPVVCMEWVIKDVEIITNVGSQITDLFCKLNKHTITGGDITLFERFILGYKNYFYRIDVTPKNPIRQNRDKDYLPSFSEEGNDCTYSVSLGLGKIKTEPDLTTDALNKIVIESMEDYDPKVKKERYNRHFEKWTNKTLFQKSFNEYKERFSLFTAIYPFTDHDLSGLTEVLSLDIYNDDEDGFGICIAIMGFHFDFHSASVQRWVSKTFVKRPAWIHGTPWEDFRKIYKQWAKEHPVRHFLDVDWRFEIGINRVYGFFYRSDIDNSSKGTSCFNPFRNKFWNLI